MIDYRRIPFRPSLTIFVDDVGRRIYDRFHSDKFSALLDVSLRRSIGLMHVSAASNGHGLRAHPLPAGEEFARDAPCKEGNLDEVIRDLLEYVQSESKRLETDSSVYGVPQPRTQIYIVGSVDSPWMGDVLQAVHQRLSDDDFQTLVCYILSGYRSGFNSNNNPLTSPMDWSQRVAPNFVYLYENMVRYPYPTYVTLKEADYAAAEALFSLIATGITVPTVPENGFFQEIQQAGMPNLDDYIDYEGDEDEDEEDEDADGNKKPVYNEYSNRVGGMTTSMIVFPREAVTHYLGALLAADVMAAWLAELARGRLSDKERQQEQGRAQADAANLRDWIRDSMLRPGIRAELKEHKAPDLALLDVQDKNKRNTTDPLRHEQIAYQQQEKRRILIDRTKALFRLFSDEGVDREYKKRKKRTISSSDGWLRAADRLAGKAVDNYRDWDSGATSAWCAVRDRVYAELRKKIDRFIRNHESSDNGHELARTYIDAFDDRLAMLADQMVEWRESHANEYKEELSRFEQLALGEWVTDTSSAIVGGTSQQATPTMGGQGPSGIVTLSSTGVLSSRFQTSRMNSSSAPSNAGNNNAGGGGAQSNTAILNAPSSGSGGSTHHHFPEREERIERHLRARIRWKHLRMPRLATQVTAGGMFLGLVDMLEQALLPSHTLVSLSVLSALAVFVAGGNALFYRRRQQEVELAKKDLLNFYTLYYAHLCEQREDELRLLVMGPLRRRVQRMRERLDEMNSFVNQVRQNLLDQANNVCDELFTGPSGVRDIFVANGYRLQKEGNHTLETFKTVVDRERLKASGEEEWHRTPEAIKSQLIREFEERPESIIELREEVAQEAIYGFMLPIIQAYLRGWLVEIQSALDKEDVWVAVLDRVQKQLYRSRSGQRDPAQMLICGRGEDIVKGEKYQPRRVARVRTHSKDWLLVAAVFRGGPLSSLNTDMLFPFIASDVLDDDDADALNGTIDDLDALAAAATTPTDIDDIPIDPDTTN